MGNYTFPSKKNGNDEIEAVNYTEKDWIRVYKENIKWADRCLEEEADYWNRFHWKWYIGINKRQLQVLESKQPKRVFKSTTSIKEIKERIDIVQVIEHYVTLRGRNHQYYGYCPLHSDHSPSLSVDSEKQLWHCFGCGKGGDVIDFIKLVENIDIRGAMKKLGGMT